MAHEFDPEKLPTTSHGFFKDCIALLEAEGLARVLGVGTSTAYKQAEDPDLTEKPVRNFLDRLRAVFRKLEKIGHVDLAVAGLQHLADSIGMRVIPKSCPMPDKDCLEHELLDDLPHLSRLHDAIQQGASLVEVERLAEKAKREIDEDVTMYRQHLGEAV